MDPRKIKRIVIIAVVLLLALAIGTSCWYTVDEKEQAVVTTFGKAVSYTHLDVYKRQPYAVHGHYARLL